MSERMTCPTFHALSHAARDKFRKNNFHRPTKPQHCISTLLGAVPFRPRATVRSWRRNYLRVRQDFHVGARCRKPAQEYRHRPPEAHWKKSVAG